MESTNKELKDFGLLETMTFRDYSFEGCREDTLKKMSGVPSRIIFALMEMLEQGKVACDYNPKSTDAHSLLSYLAAELPIDNLLTKEEDFVTSELSRFYGFIPDANSPMETFACLIYRGDTPYNDAFASALWDWLGESYVERMLYENEVDGVDSSQINLFDL